MPKNDSAAADGFEGVESWGVTGSLESENEDTIKNGGKVLFNLHLL